MGTLFLLFLWISIKYVVGDNPWSTVVLTPTTEANNLTIFATGRKHDLRYGFHQVADCNSFEQSFLCIQKCVDLNYDLAHADKRCKCTCFKKKDKDKYKSVSGPTRTRWRSGAPKTSIPPWAGGQPPVEKVTTAPEVNVLESSAEEALKGNSTDKSKGEVITKDQVTGGDASSSPAGTENGATVASGDVSTNAANEVTSGTSVATAAAEVATAAPTE